MQAHLYALGVIALWAALAALSVSLPALFARLTDLLIVSVPAWPQWRRWKLPSLILILTLGIFDLFGFHFLLFIAMRCRQIPTWPTTCNRFFMAVVASLFLPGIRLRRVHVLATLLSFARVVVAVLGNRIGTHAGQHGLSVGLCASTLLSLN